MLTWNEGEEARDIQCYKQHLDALHGEQGQAGDVRQVQEQAQAGDVRQVQEPSQDPPPTMSEEKKQSEPANHILHVPTLLRDNIASLATETSQFSDNDIVSYMCGVLEQECNPKCYHRDELTMHLLDKKPSLKYIRGKCSKCATCSVFCGSANPQECWCMHSTLDHARILTVEKETTTKLMVKSDTVKRVNILTQKHKCPDSANLLQLAYCAAISHLWAKKGTPGGPSASLSWDSNVALVEDGLADCILELQQQTQLPSFINAPAFFGVVRDHIQLAIYWISNLRECACRLSTGEPLDVSDDSSLLFSMEQFNQLVSFSFPLFLRQWLEEQKSNANDSVVEAVTKILTRLPWLVAVMALESWMPVSFLETHPYWSAALTQVWNVYDTASMLWLMAPLQYEMQTKNKAHLVTWLHKVLRPHLQPSSTFHQPKQFIVRERHYQLLFDLSGVFKHLNALSSKSKTATAAAAVQSSFCPIL